MNSPLDPKKPATVWAEVVTLLCVLALCAVGFALMFGWTDARGAAGQPVFHPGDNCIASRLHPHSGVAEHCRSHGWVIRPRLVVSQHGVVRVHHVPHCDFDEAQRDLCTWNVGRRTDGNGVGLSFWSAGGRVHYVWPERPLGYPVDDDLGDALAEGEKQETWRTCWVDEAGTHARCPDGFEVRVWTHG